MIRLTNTTTDLLACTPSSTNVVKTMVSFTDVTASTWTGNSEPHSLAAASKATICATPAASTVREIDHVTITATGGANTITVIETISATDYTLLSAALSSGDMLEYTHASGWRVVDSNGSVKFTLGNVTGNLTVGGTLTSTGQLIGKGTATNDSAAAGNIGEFIDSAVTAVTVANSGITNVTTISLTAGDWEVTGRVNYNGAVGNTNLTAGISVTSVSLTGTAGKDYATNFVNSTTGNGLTEIACLRKSLSVTTTIYLVAAFNSVSTTCDGYISARRIR